MSRYRTFWPTVAAGLLSSALECFAQGNDPIGINALRAYDPTLTGSGVIVVQAEAGGSSFEVNPAYVGQPASKFVYIDMSGDTSTTFSSGEESGHADGVGDYFYGDTNTANPEGVAPGVSAIYNYEADYFVNNIINDGTDGIPIPGRIVNQSFIAVTSDNAEQEEVEQIYDDYAATYNTLFISGVGNGGHVYSPASSYNGIGVAAYGGASSIGPTYDGRSKPDITAPAGATSFSTPQVSGAAAILLQGAERGDAGAGTESDASDARTLKALLLNGAVKPGGWTNTPTAPLDTRYGAGILNVYNSYRNLQAGEYASSGATSGSVAAMSTGTFVADEGWDLVTVTNASVSGTYTTESNHYLFDLAAATAPDFELTCTLMWWKQVNQTGINNLDLYLFDATTGAMMDVSDSTVDNVQELYPMVDGAPVQLAPGEYDIVVAKNGGTSIDNGGSVVSPSETYALAFNFAPVPEPSACWLLLPGLGFLMVRRRNRAGKLRFDQTGVL
jgi:hypothetical protein